MPQTRTESRADLFRALGVLAEPPGREHARLAALLGVPEPDGPQWTEAFVVQLVPYASVYLSADGMLGGEPADRVAGFWRALRLAVPAEPDHVTALLGLYAWLIDAEHGEPESDRRALRRQARVALLHEHLLTWLLPYAAAMAQAGPPSYVVWATLLADTVDAEAVLVGPPEGLPVHLGKVAAPREVTDGLDEVVARLFAPARSGMVLTRAHLAEIARGAGLGLRRGPRQLVLRALIEQEPAGTLAALAELSAAWSTWHLGTEPVAGPIATYWADRAHTSATDLRAAAAAAGKEST